VVGRYVEAGRYRNLDEVLSLIPVQAWREVDGAGRETVAGQAGSNEGEVDPGVGGRGETVHETPDEAEVVGARDAAEAVGEQPAG
jgi:hypothetical protein